MKSHNPDTQRSLPPKPDDAILRIVRALAVAAAREDHEREMQARSDLRPLLD